jgi:hypothetical protein
VLKFILNVLYEVIELNIEEIMIFNWNSSFMFVIYFHNCILLTKFNLPMILFDDQDFYYELTD